MFRTKSTDKLNEAHTLGLGAITFIDDLVADLDTAATLAGEHAAETSAAIEQLSQERDGSFEAKSRYATVADKLRGLVSA